MIDIYFDAFLCACPAVEEGEDRFEEFLRGILLLVEIPNTSWLRLSTSRCSAEALYQAGRYPVRPDIERAVAAFGRSYIEPRDIIEIVNRLLSRQPTLEDRLELSDFLYDQLVTIPRIQTPQIPLNNEAFEKHIVLAAFNTSVKDGDRASDLLVSSGLALSCSNLLVQASITCIDPEPARTLPYCLSSSLNVCSSWHTVCTAITIDQAWAASTTDDDYVGALKIYLISHSTAATTPQLAWKFGPDFVESFVVLGFDRQQTKIRSLLRACSETIYSLNMSATHSLRRGAGPNELQLKKGRWKAWRRDIDHEYHLHYWENGDEVEFAAVVVHNDFRIP